MSEPRLTVFLGAGAAIEIGAPTTFQITQEVRNKKQDLLDREVDFINRVAQVLDESFSEPSNFEEIFHTLELINSYRTGWRGAVKEYTPYLASFVQPRLKRFFKDNIALNLAQNDLISTVANMVEAYSAPYAEKAENKWHCSFWNKASQVIKLDIATLNYDTCIEQSIGSIEDGFLPTEHGFERFSPVKLLDAVCSRIFHLHGCITYGFARTRKPNTYALEDDFHDLYKYPSLAEAQKTWTGRSSNFTQSSEEAVIGPLITGLKKTDKVVNFPYSTYFSVLHHSVVRNTSLLIVGYSFGDVHFNRLLDRVAGIHGSKRKIVIITKYSKPYWHRDWSAMGWPEKRDMMIFASRAFQDFYPFDTGSSFGGPPEVLISKDGCARIYLRGFRDAVEDHGDDILSFLSSQ